MTEKEMKSSAFRRLLNRIVMFFRAENKPLWPPETQRLIDENKRLSERLGRTLSRMENKSNGVTIDLDSGT